MFKDNVLRANKSAESAINWEYYGIMKNHFGKIDSVASIKNILVWSNVSNSRINEKKLHEIIRPQTTNDTEVSSGEEHFKPQKKKFPRCFIKKNEGRLKVQGFISK